MWLLVIAFPVPCLTFRGKADSFSSLATLLDSNGPNWVRFTSWVRANTPSVPSSNCLISKLEGRDDLKIEENWEEKKQTNSYTWDNTTGAHGRKKSTSISPISTDSKIFWSTHPNFYKDLQINREEQLSAIEEGQAGDYLSELSPRKSKDLKGCTWWYWRSSPIPQ